MSHSPHHPADPSTEHPAHAEHTGHAGLVGHGAHVASLALYFTVFGILMVGTAITVAVAYVDLGAMNTPVALLIAITKAAFVLLYFMHLRWSDRMTSLFIGAAFAWFGILMLFTFSDVVTRLVIPFPKP